MTPLCEAPSDSAKYTHLVSEGGVVIIAEDAAHLAALTSGLVDPSRAPRVADGDQYSPAPRAPRVADGELYSPSPHSPHVADGERYTPSLPPSHPLR